VVEQASRPERVIVEGIQNVRPISGSRNASADSTPVFDIFLLAARLAFVIFDRGGAGLSDCHPRGSRVRISRSWFPLRSWSPRLPGATLPPPKKSPPAPQPWRPASQQPMRPQVNGVDKMIYMTSTSGNDALHA